jgi:hypothetical protein
MILAAEAQFQPTQSNLTQPRLPLSQPRNRKQIHIMQTWAIIFLVCLAVAAVAVLIMGTKRPARRSGEDRDSSESRRREEFRNE